MTTQSIAGYEGNRYTVDVYEDGSIAIGRVGEHGYTTKTGKTAAFVVAYIEALANDERRTPEQAAEAFDDFIGWRTTILAGDHI